ncbi:YqaJ-like viral recombinase [Methylobacterium sp. Leaf90]|nr:YqaJ-like viral recombinase [Methylobacterium sp. Leaf90]
MEMIDKAGMRPTVRIHHDLHQGTEEWLAARCGMLTASEMGLIITPATLKAAKNEKERAHLYELLAQRVSGYVEPHYVSHDMLRGHEDEIEALALYAKHFAPTEAVGFVTNDKWGFTLGYSPDAFVGADGLVETKSRRQKYQIETFVVHVLAETIPADYVIQIQTGLLVTERAWCDLISYSGGLPLARIRAYPDPKIQSAIVEAAEGFETRLEEARAKYLEAIEKAGNIPTVRRLEGEILA